MAQGRKCESSNEDRKKINIRKELSLMGPKDNLLRSKTIRYSLVIKPGHTGKRIRKTA